MKFAVMLVVLSVACGACGPALPDPSFAEEPGQALALYKIWNGTYGRKDSAPRIGWVRGAELDCPNGFMGETAAGRECLHGSYTDGDDFVRIADDSAWQLELAHELAHVAQYRDRGFSDHSAPWFVDGQAGPVILAAAKSAGAR